MKEEEKKTNYNSTFNLTHTIKLVKEEENKKNYNSTFNLTHTIKLVKKRWLLEYHSTNEMLIKQNINNHTNSIK